jgi:hypothetical protein
LPSSCAQSQDPLLRAGLASATARGMTDHCR